MEKSTKRKYYYLNCDTLEIAEDVPCDSIERWMCFDSKKDIHTERRLLARIRIVEKSIEINKLNYVYNESDKILELIRIKNGEDNVMLRVQYTETREG